MAKTNPGEFIRQVRAEAGKVVWPTRQETVRTAIFVAIMMTILAIFFLGAGSKPQPISEREAARYFGGVAEAKAAPKQQVSVDYDIGDQVKVLDGPFASFNGVVEELDFDKQKVKVSVSIFGRATPVELEFEQVELVK